MQNGAATPAWPAQQGRNLEIVPTITIGQQTRGAAGEAWRSDKASIEPGVDVRLGAVAEHDLNAALSGFLGRDRPAAARRQRQLRPVLQEKRPVLPRGRGLLHHPVRRALHPPDRRSRLRAARDRAQRQQQRRDRGATRHAAGAGAGRARLGLRGARRRSTSRSAATADFNEHASLGVIGCFREGDQYSNDVVGVDGPLEAGAAHRHRAVPAQPVGISAGVHRSRDWRWRDRPRPVPTAPRSATHGARNIPSATTSWYFDTAHGRRSRLPRRPRLHRPRSATKSLAGGGYTEFRDGRALNRVNLYADFDITHRYDGQLLEREWGKRSCRPTAPGRTTSACTRYDPRCVSGTARCSMNTTPT